MEDLRQSQILVLLLKSQHKMPAILQRFWNLQERHPGLCQRRKHLQLIAGLQIASQLAEDLHCVQLRINSIRFILSPHRECRVHRFILSTLEIVVTSTGCITDLRGDLAGWFRRGAFLLISNMTKRNYYGRHPCRTGLQTFVIPNFVITGSAITWLVD